MYGIRLYWEMDADGSWFYTIGELKVTGFWCESAAYRAGLRQLKTMEKKMLEDLEAELIDVNRCIDQIIMAPQHIGELSYDSSSLESLMGRRTEIVKLLENPFEDNDNNP